MIEVQLHLQGQVVDGRYPLNEFLGATQHSSVFQTECEEAPNRQAAIKLIPAPAGSSGAQITRWRLASRFSHPALLRIFQMGRCELDGRPMLYVITECAEENLGEILRVRCLSPGEVDALLGPALDALGYLHGKGFVHGHLRPSNILAIGDQVKLSSDSIARIGEAADPHEPGDPYCAPEGSLSAATDIWSLGVTLVQCLTGRVPERGAEGGHGIVVPPDVPAPFFDLARHCLNPVPQRRWSMAQLRSSLAPGSTVVAPAPAPESSSAPASADVSDSAFVNPKATAPVRRRVHIRKKYRLPLAVLAAASAAFIFGIVISGSGSTTTVTASSPEPNVVQKSPADAMVKDSVKAQSLESSRKMEAAPPRAERLNSKAPRGESRPSELAQNANSGPPIIVSKATPDPTQPPPAASADSGNLVPGSVSRRALPRVPASASNTIWGTVRVSVIVDVDPRGRVVETKLDSAGPSQYFARLSMAAAQDWKFEPPRVDGNIVPSEWVINFGYTKTDTSATADEKHP